MTHPALSRFKFCPQCGAQLPPAAAPNRIACARCGFHYYFNPTVSAAAIVTNAEGQVLLLRRSVEPARGKWSLPGGFVDCDETAEMAVQRETREEVGIEIDAVQFLCSQINHYPYRDITYPVLDLFFQARAVTAAARPLDGAEEVAWCDPRQINPDELSFPSVREAWRQFTAATHPRQ